MCRLQPQRHVGLDGVRRRGDGDGSLDLALALVADDHGPDLARQVALLTSTDLPLGAVARRCGFRSTETLRQTFHDLYATSPSAYRTAAAVRT